LEVDVAKKAWWRTESGKPVLVTYDSRSADDDIAWGFGLGCNGVVRVLLERLGPGTEDHLAFVAHCLQRGEPGVLCTVFQADGEAAPVGARLFLGADREAAGTLTSAGFAAPLLADARRILASGLSETQTYVSPNEGTAVIFLEAILPPVPLVIFGGGHDAVPLARLAKEMGWNVTVVDTRAVRPHPERFPGANTVLACAPDAVAARVPLIERTVAVVMTHNYHDDGALLGTLLASPARYVGVLGPRRRTERLLADLAADGMVFDTEAVARKLHAPVGLDIGADNPAEIALSILAEIQATLAGRGGGSLSNRQGPIHARPDSLFLPSLGTTTTEVPACALITPASEP
jgi:xanthine/CO dehydrogenase XdhC/CoxF family maturation factor